MSPAMVDVRTPSATPQSPTNPQIPAPSNPSPNPDPSSMDRGGCSLFGEFVPPFPSPSFRASNKAAGLSKPRLAKMRRHLASPRVRQATISDAQLGPAANPFHPGMQAASGSGNVGGSDLNPGAKKADSVNEGSRHSSVSLDAKNTGVFVFGSEVKKSSISSQSSSVGLDESSSLKFPNIRKEGEKDVRAGNLFVFGSMRNAANSVDVHDVCEMGLHKAGNEGGFENAQAADCSSKLGGSNAGIFESNKNVPGCVGGGSGDTYPDKTQNSTRSSSIGSDEGLSTKLPEDMKKMNMKSNGIENVYEFRSRPDDTTKVDGNNMFVFGSSKGEPGFFGDYTRSNPPCNGSGLSEGSSFCSIDSSSSTLSDQMRKLNLQSSNDENGSLEHGKEDGHKVKVDESKVFIFGSVKNTPGLFDCAMKNESPNEMRSKDIGTETASRTKDESVNFAAGAFVFGSNARSSVLNQNSAASSSSHDKRTASVVNTESLKKTTEACTSNGFASGSGWEIPSSLQGGSTETLPHDIRKLHSKKVEPFAGSTNQMFTHSGLATDSLYNSLNFACQAEKQNTNMRTQAVPVSHPHDHCRSAGVTDSSSHPSTPGPKIEPTGAEFTFTGMHVKSEAPNMEFKTLNQDALCFRDNMFTGLQRNLESGTKKKFSKGTKMSKKKGKLRSSVSFQQRFAEHFPSRETGSHEKPGTESPAGCSPMDCSPYQEILVSDPCPREISITSDEPTLHASYGAFSDAQKDDLVSAAQHLGTKKGDGKHGDVDDVKSYAESEMPKNEDVGSKIYTDTTTKEAESLLFSSNLDQQSTESRTSFSFSSSIGVGEPSFTFISSPSVHGQSSLLKHHNRRKDRVKAGQQLFNSTHDAKVPFVSSPFQVASTSAHHGTVQGLNGTPFVPQSGSDSRPEKNNDVDIKSEFTPSIAAKEACEKWRLRGNEAYANGFLVKAEDYYTRGVDSVSPKETSRSCMKALMLCYSNRAATRMSLGRMREALSDCLMAAAIDPSFLKAQLRAGNCHLALGESQDAMKHFKKCLQLGDDANVDKKISTEALEGLQKAQKVADCVDESAELLVKRTVSEARRALDIISEALSISPHSERLLEMKAESLFLLRSYEEVVQLCQQTMASSERNYVITDCDSSEGRSVSPGSLWRWRLISMSYFYLGKLEEALDILQKHEQVEPVADKYRSMPPVSSAPLSVTIRDLLRLKAAGNEAFQAGRHLEAVEHYTAALACNTESRPFAAICFCNRAAAYQALGQVADAIADCSLAIALESGYAKAISRRATLHEMIRDYGQAASDIRRLISLLEQQTEAAENSSDVKQARRRLSAMEEEVKKDIPLDMYMILGIQQSCSTADVKKAYRKAALRHHPDKAVQFLARSDVDDGLWKDIANEMHKDADRLFKIIGEAYSILSDSTKRAQYDTEEEMRTASKKGNSGIGTPRTPKTAAEGYSSPYEKNVNRRQWRDRWRSYGSSQQNWSEFSRSNI